MLLLCFAQEMLLQRCFAVSLLATFLLGLGASATPSAQGDAVLQASSGGVLLAGQSLPQVRTCQTYSFADAPIWMPQWYALCWMRRCDQLLSIILST